MSKQTVSSRATAELTYNVASANCLAAFKLIGDMPTLAIIYFLSGGQKRFSQLEKLTRINPGTLTSRLKQLYAADLIERREQQADNQSVTYRLSVLGSQLLPILDQIETFAEKLSLSEK